MDENTRYLNAKRLALALEEHSGEWGIIQQLTLRLHYDDPAQLRQAVHDLAGCFDVNANDDTEKLINCPFCGGHAEYERRQPKDGYYPVPEIRTNCVRIIFVSVSACSTCVLHLPCHLSGYMIPETSERTFPDITAPCPFQVPTLYQWHNFRIPPEFQAPDNSLLSVVCAHIPHSRRKTNSL